RSKNRGCAQAKNQRHYGSFHHDFAALIRVVFTANLQKISGQDVKTGPFSADVVVRLNFY
ncbi:hypothetical protein ACYF6Y_20505, partial [Citrobacter sp. EBS8]